MSCIPKILELLGDKEYLHVPHTHLSSGVVVEGGGEYKGYYFLVTFNEHGFRCGYVAISKELDKNPMDLDYEIFDVHGGVTFYSESHIAESFFGENTCGDKWVGFDCAHAGDGYDYQRSFEIFKTEYSSRLKSMFDNDDCIRSKEYVISECKRLIDQIIKHEEEAKQ